jgi:transposase
MVLCFACNQETPRQKTFVNDPQGRATMREFVIELAQRSGATRIVFVYEASGLGFGLCDFLREVGIECRVVPPSLLEKSSKQRRQKTDARDAEDLFEKARAHVLAGNKLPTAWTPPQVLRDDRELVRARIATAEDSTAVKLQILALLKRYGRELPEVFRKHHNWTQKFMRWVAAEAEQLPIQVQPVLQCLVQRQQQLQAEIDCLEDGVKLLAKNPRYRTACEGLRKITGVGLMTAMTFLTEMGDLTRFSNRRQVGSYLGLAPCSHESGEASDRKGHITRQGPSRLRKMLCQATWSAIRRDADTRAKHDRISKSKQQLRKKAAVALMRQLGIRMWHAALEAGVSSELVTPATPPPKWLQAIPPTLAQAN